MASKFIKKPLPADGIGDFEEASKNVSTMQDGWAQVMTNRNSKKSKNASASQANGCSPEVQRELAEVYADDDGDIPDMTKLDYEEKPLWQKILYWLTVTVAAIFFISLAGFLILNNLGKESFTNEKVTFKIEPPLAVVSGQEAVYNIIIVNNEKVNLYDLNIDLQYPDAFEYVSATPEAAGDKKNSWNFGVLEVGQTIKIELRAKITAPLNSVHNLAGIVNFKPENMNSDFQQKMSVDLGVNSSVIVLDVSGPDKSLANQNVEYTVRVRNNGLSPLADLELVADYPQGFVLASTTPDPKDGLKNIWEISKLATSTENSTSSDLIFKINGNYSGVVDSGNQEMKIKANLKHDSEYILQTESTVITNVVKDQMNLTLVINGSGEDQPVGFGDLLLYTLNYKNTGQDELKDVTLTAELNSDILDWDSVRDEHGGKKTAGKITWTGKQVPQLLTLRPGEEGSITWQVRIKEMANIEDLVAAKLSVENQAKAEFKSGNEDASVQSKMIVNSINSDLGLSAGARYYDENNIALGSGPISPKAGEVSSYNIKLSLQNNLHDVSGLEITAALPVNVNWDSKENHDTGDINYSSLTKKVTWSISRLSKKATGANFDFNISLTPKEADIGRVLVLIPEIKLTGRDTETGATISKTIKAITTSFEDPILGQISGIVD